MKITSKTNVRSIILQIRPHTREYDDDYNYDVVVDEDDDSGYIGEAVEVL